MTRNDLNDASVMMAYGRKKKRVRKSEREHIWARFEETWARGKKRGSEEEQKRKRRRRRRRKRRRRRRYVEMSVKIVEVRQTQIN